MIAYRLYCLDSAGHIQFAEPIEARDDVDAVQRAHELKLNHIKCEVWQADRLVATLNAQDLSG